MKMMLNSFYVDDLIKRAIQEDINYLDVTSDYLLPLNRLAPRNSWRRPPECCAAWMSLFGSFSC